MSRKKRLENPFRVIVDIEQIDNQYLELMAMDLGWDKSEVIREIIRPAIRKWIEKKSPEVLQELKEKFNRNASRDGRKSKVVGWEL